jgi:hypothetical protein
MRCNKLLTAFAVTSAVVLAPAAAFANDCANLSRGAGNAVPWETTRGRWSFIAPDVGELWVFSTPDNFHNGTADALLEDSPACNGSRLLGQTKGELTIDNLKGIWSEECVNTAAADAGIGG